MGPTVNMKYLEDYVDTIEALPLELQRNFSLIRELDAASQKVVKSMESEVVAFTSRVRELDPERRNDWLRQLLTSFEDTVKHGEEKLALATQTYDMVDRHIRRLDDDLQRFEEEQLVSPRVPGAMMSANVGGSSSIRKRPRKENTATGGVVGAGGGAGQEASSRKKGRTSGQTTGRSSTTTTTTTTSGTQKQRGTSGRSNASGASSGGQRGAAIAASRDRAHQLSESSDMPIDPNEPTYCFCQQVSFGEMVACDNPDCDIEWFHFECVGLKQLPKGEWFCPNCRKGKK